MPKFVHQLPDAEVLFEDFKSSRITVELFAPSRTPPKWS
jgi:hypothetical protein